MGATVVAATVLSFATAAYAAPAVTISPAGPYTDQQNVTVSGTGFPTNSADPSGLQIIQCSDPGGTTGNLPIDDTSCDATTINPLPVLTDSNGDFSTSYTLSALSTSNGSNIDCSLTAYCVLWVGLDYANSFSGTHAFSSAFLIKPSLQNQSISFTSTAPGDAVVGGSPYTPVASASSGLPVALTIDATATSVCSISSGVVHFLAVGTCVVDANQAGNATYQPAPQVQQTFSVGPALTPQTIRFTSTAPDPGVIGNTYTPTASASSGLPVTLTVDATATSVCSIGSGVVTLEAVGTCVIDANQAGNTTYQPAPQVQQSFPVVSTSPTATFTSTVPSTGTLVLGPEASVTDTATVTGSATNGSPTGTVTFYACQTATSQTLAPGPCAATAGNELDSAHVTAGADDTATATSGSLTPTGAGTWCFSSVYTSSGVYTGSSDNTSSTNVDPNECLLVTDASSSTESIVSSAEVVLGPSGAISDDVTVGGGVVAGAPTGSVAFYACLTGSGSSFAPGPCAPTGTPEDTGEMLLPGAGDSSSATSASFLPPDVGTWCFSAVYGGDANYAGSSDNTDSSNLDTDECVLVTAAPSSTASAVSSAHVSLGPSDTVTDTVTVTGNTVGDAPTGNVDFYVCGPGSAAALCTSTTVRAGTPALAASGQDAATARSSAITPTAQGVYCFAAVYVPAASSNYTGSSDNVSGTPDSSECVNVGPPAAYTFTTAASTTTSVGASSFAFTVRTYGTPDAKIKRKGTLPKGVHFIDHDDNSATLSGPPKKSGVFHLTFTATFGKGKTKHVTTQAFTLTVT
ncbi:MAG TPA: hypothetical protein VMB72_01880 [Acidimicrobiales bacterium]|nr:hypothetical protein [Acidimicrobiales bacterium]